MLAEDVGSLAEETFLKALAGCHTVSTMRDGTLVGNQVGPREAVSDRIGGDRHGACLGMDDLGAGAAAQRERRAAPLGRLE